GRDAAMASELAALKLGNGSSTRTLDEAVVPVPGDADAVALDHLIVAGRRERLYVIWCGARDRLGRPCQILNRFAKATGEMVRPFDKQCARRGVDGDGKLGRHPSQPPCLGRVCPRARGRTKYSGVLRSRAGALRSSFASFATSSQAGPAMPLTCIV